MLVVSDTSPVRALAHLSCLDVLGDLFGEVLLPPAVERELRHPPAQLRSVDVSRFSFLRVEMPQNQVQVRSFLESLDPGESEALSLALERKADAVLIDEAAGRRTATQLGLTVIGTLGILLRAKQKRLIGEIGPMINRLENELGFFISRALRDEMLRRADE